MSSYPLPFSMLHSEDIDCNTILVKNMISCFDRVVTAQTAEIFLREKSQPIFAYRSVVSDHSCHSYTQ